MRAYTAQQMRAADAAAIGEYGIPGLQLMERAGAAVTGEIQKRYPVEIYTNVCIVCGTGNNGGDGYVIARLLGAAGYKVQVVATAPPRTEDAGVMRKRYAGAVAEVQQAEQLLTEADLIVDALLGTGVTGALRGPAAMLCAAVCAAGKPVVSVDVPSGLDADTGAYEQAVRAELTVTLAGPKLGLYIYPGAECCGEIVTGDIGMPQAILDAMPAAVVSDPKEPLLRLAPREKNSNKGSYGRVLLIGGSRGMAGSISLAATGALRVGAGLVTAAVPQCIEPVVAGKLWEAMTLPLDDADGVVAPDARAALDALRQRTCGAVGCGLGAGKNVRSFMRELLRETERPLVIDADGLNAVAEERELLRAAGITHVVTPHPGELARLLGTTPAEIQKNRLASACRLAEECGVVTLLKGAGTIVASPDGRIYVNRSGGPALAKGGSGDLLTGMIAGLIAQGYEPFEAAAKGAYYHGLAGDLCAARMAERAVLARDVAQALCEALREY